MALHPGTRLGAYEIVALLGAGGMGEVYRARDLRLQREVALKVLPDAADADPDRRERFAREALAVAALNHPHIVTIHSVEEAESKIFLTMELVHGRSLGDALPSNGLPVDRVLAIGLAVADAVASAHQKGITHRDLKPANIMLGEGEHAGRIKVLDFGLAKVVEAPLGAPAGSMVPTEAPAHRSPRTAEGRILGTVAYMSPEQAEGRPLDGRSDLFSLGVVLYEMATGRRPFVGDTNVSILSSILKDTPTSVTDINPAIPRDLARIIRRALAKDPERRYQSAKDLRNDLEDLKTSLESGELAAASIDESRGLAAASTPRPSSSSALRGKPHESDQAAANTPAASSDTQVAAALIRRHSGAVFAVAAVVTLAAALTGYAVLRRDATLPSNARADTHSGASLADVHVEQLTASGTAERPALSADGKYVAYIEHEGDDYSLWIRQTATTSKQRIVAPEPGVALFGATFTPDGTSVDFVRQARGTPNWEVWRVPFLGGIPKLFIANVASPVSWSPDGQRVAFVRTEIGPVISSQLIVANADGSRERALGRSEAPTLWLSLAAPWRPSFAPAWSPDGRVIALIATSPAGTPRIAAVDSGTGTVHEIPIPGGTTHGLCWLDAQSLVVNQPVAFGAPNQLFRQPYAEGPLSRLTNDPNDYVGASLSADRRSLVTSRRDVRMDLWLGDAAAGTGADLVRRVPISVERVAWAGDQLLYGGVVGVRPALIRVSSGKTEPEEVVLDAVAPAATSDGRTIVFVSTADNSLDLWTADTNGRRKTLLVRSVTAEPVAVTPDNRSVLFTSIADGTVSIWMVPIDGGSATKLTDGNNVAVSPDGRSIAFTTELNGAPLLRVCSLPACSSPKTIGSAQLDTALAWPPEGGSVAFVRAGNVWVQPLSGGAPRQLTHFTDGRPIRSFAWSPDGKRLALVRVSVTNDIVLFRGLK